jgi:hypothetical protein
MASSGGTSTTKVVTKEVKITWGFCNVSPILQVLEYYLKQRKNNG